MSHAPRLENHLLMRSLRPAGSCALWIAAAFWLSSPLAHGQVRQFFGDLAPGESVTIAYEVTISENALPTVAQISNQGSVSGENFSTVQTDDPESAAADDPTVTVISNNAPVLDLNGATDGDEITVDFTEQTPVKIAPAGTIVDSENNPILALTLTLGARPDGDSVEWLSLDAFATAAAAGASLSVGSYDQGTGILAITGSAAASVYQSVLQGVVYGNDSDNLDLTARAVSVVASDTYASAPRISTITVNSVNDLPIGGDNTVTTAEDTARSFSVEDFPYSDLEGGALAGIQIISSPAAGSLTVDGVEASQDDVISQLPSLVFTPAAHAFGDAYSAFTFKVRDADGGASEGTYVMTIDVTSVNDGPVANDDAIERSASEDVKVRIESLLANDTDADGDTIVLTGVTSPTGGGATVLISGAWIYYTRNGAAADEFLYSVSDGREGTATGKVRVNIKDGDTQFSQRLAISYDANGAQIGFDGIPGRAYVIQYQDALDGGPWQDLGTATDAGQGRFTFSDHDGSVNRFYRSVFR